MKLFVNISYIRTEILQILSIPVGFNLLMWDTSLSHVSYEIPSLFENTYVISAVKQTKKTVQLFVKILPTAGLKFYKYVENNGIFA